MPIKDGDIALRIKACRVFLFSTFDFDLQEFQKGGHESKKHQSTFLVQHLTELPAEETESKFYIYLHSFVSFTCVPSFGGSILPDRLTELPDLGLSLVCLLFQWVINI